MSKEEGSPAQPPPQTVEEQANAENISATPEAPPSNQPAEGGTEVAPKEASAGPRAISLDFGVASEQGTRKTMEDQHKALLGGDPLTPTATGGFDEKAPVHSVPFFGVYDGHGGTLCAKFLRDHLHHMLLRHPALLKDPEAALKECVLKVEQMFLQECVEKRIESGSTCAVAFILEGKYLVTGNVGDSEIILCRGNQPVLLTTKHNLGTNQSEMDRVVSAGGRVYKSRIGHPKFNPQLVSLGVSRAIGDVGFKLDEYTDGKASGLIADADTKVTEISHEDEFILLGCDGLWDVLSYQEAVEFCLAELQRNGADSQAVTQALVRKALMAGSTDNVTVMLINLRAPAEKTRCSEE